MDLSTLSVPETAFTLTDCCEISALADADRVKFPGDAEVTESEPGRTVTPLGRPVIVTVAVPVNPFSGAIETCSGCPEAPCVSVILPLDSDTVKLGLGGVGAEPPEPPPLLPPPQAVMNRQRRPDTIGAQRRLSRATISIPHI